MESGKEEQEEVWERTLIGIPSVWKIDSEGKHILLSREDSLDMWYKNSIDLEDKSNGE